jgi:hypothetical protein
VDGLLEQIKRNTHNPRGNITKVRDFLQRTGFCALTPLGLAPTCQGS